MQEPCVSSAYIWTLLILKNLDIKVNRIYLFIYFYLCIFAVSILSQIQLPETIFIGDINQIKCH